MATKKPVKKESAKTSTAKAASAKKTPRKGLKDLQTGSGVKGGSGGLSAGKAFLRDFT